MLDQEKRGAILALTKKGLSIRRIARALEVSRATVRAVIASKGILDFGSRWR
ncbi:MAG: helix-turn-helix domain-containing protein, partial [Dehalococcoidia bacterium]